jgi:hypothetical protein
MLEPAVLPGEGEPEEDLEHLSTVQKVTFMLIRVMEVVMEATVMLLLPMVLRVLLKQVVAEEE